MAAPQFFSPPRVTPSRSRKRFTLEQANRTLPLVSRIVADVVRVHRRATEQQQQAGRLQGGSRAQIEKDLEASLERLQGLMDELSGVGCALKDFNIGLVDFIGRHRGRDVCLCWKLGESQVNYWHELDAGFAGRQPVSMLEERE